MKIVIYTSPGRGHLYPVMDIALELARRGHDIHVRTLATDVGLVEKAGLRAAPIAKAIEDRAVDDWTETSPRASVFKGLRTFVDRAVHEVDDLRAAIAASAPDLLLVDTNSWGAQAVAESSGLPWATWHPYPMPYPSKDAPPFGPGLAPARGILGRLRDRALAPLVLGTLDRFVPDLNAVRERAGAPRIARLTEQFERPPLVLHMTAEAFEYPRRDWLPNLRMTGPGLWSPPHEGRAPPWLTPDPERPFVLVTCSTEYQDDAALVDAALEAFAGDASVRLVCTTAGVDPGRFRAPKGVVVERFVPHALVVPHAAVVVCHGGMGGTQRALAAGVPPCVVPWGRDQLEVAQRVLQAEAGAMVPRKKLSPARLREAVARARARTAGAKRVAEAFANAGGAPRAASLLEELGRGAARAVA